MPDLKKMLTLEALSAALPSWLKRDTKPEYNADEIDSANTTNQFVSASDKDNWNAKGTYSLPSGGIPKSDLSSIVQTSLEKADSALQIETDPTVPSWAKQTNKPSYTQDEVADGSTYKRVTQTEKNTWSGKQNALTTTQMQAVNSGINSTKVAQIETNKTNILLIEQMNGAKNLAQINDATFTRDMYIPCELKANTDYRLMIQSFTSESSSSTSQLLFYKGDTQITDGQGGVYRAVPHGNNVSLTIQIPGDCDRVRIYSGSEGASSDNKSATFTHLMFIEKSIYDAGLTQYMPFAMSNSILTPALVDVVNKGAKNLFDYDTVTIASSGFVIPNTTPMILAEGSYEISYTANQSESGNVEIGFLDANSDLIASHTLVSQSGRNKAVLTIPTGKTSAYIYMFSANGGTFSDFMVCTESEAKISPSYQPYAKSNAQLTRDCTVYNSRIYAQATEPADTDIPEGSTWANGASVKGYERTDNLFDEKYTGIIYATVGVTYYPIQVGTGDFTLSTTTPNSVGTGSLLFLLAGNVSEGASSPTNGVYKGMSRTVTAVDGYVTVAYRYDSNYNPKNYQTMLNAGSSALPYAPYLKWQADPALVEVVDKTGKNFLDCSLDRLKAVNNEGTWNGNVYTVASVGTVTINSNKTITVVKTGTSARLVFYLSSNQEAAAISGDKFAGYILSGCPSGGSSTTYRLTGEEISSPWSTVANDYGSGDTIQSSTLQVGFYISIHADYTTTGSGLTFKPMICTETDWKTSPKFVPHRPSYDLVAALAQNGGFIDSTLGGIIVNADLNSINKTTFAVYNEPANLPSGITGYCYVRTSVFDENSALQELYVIQPNPVSFFRIKINNSWTTWAQTSNV